MRPDRMKIMRCGIALIIITILVWWIVGSINVHQDSHDTLESTPVQIDKIRSIGQWEFLSISDEELVDSIRRGFFGDSELARIYYGTLRLGIDLSRLGDDMITMDKDTVVMTLPPVTLLDDNFIDETRTRSFIEDGTWTNADRDALTRKAAAAMKQRCLTKDNYRKAEQNAITQMTSLLKAMGVKQCRVEIKERV